MKQRLIVIAALCLAWLETRGMGWTEFIEAVLAERQRQNQQWGGPEHDRRHSDLDWLLVLSKHMGKLAGSVGQPVSHSDTWTDSMNEAMDAFEAVRYAGQLAERVI